MREKVRWRDWLVVCLGILLATRTAANVWRLYKTGERVKEAEAELEEAKRTNEELRVKLDEVNSPEFIEKEAREKLGYGREGEVILVMPQEEGESRIEAAETNKERPNWKKWWDLYIRL